MGFIEWFLRLLFGLLYFLIFGMSSGTTSPSVDPAPAQIDTVVENVDALILESFPMQLTLHVTGYHPDACAYPVIVDQTIEGNTIMVHIYREVPANVRCGGDRVPYDANISIDATFEGGVYTIIVNNVTLEVDFGGSTGTATATPFGPLSTSTVVVENVDVLMLESFPVQLQLRVTGYYPDGCDFPPNISQSRDGNTVSVIIQREVPVDVMCPAVIMPFDLTIPLDGGFDPGTYTIDVNGFIVTVNI